MKYGISADSYRLFGAELDHRTVQSYNEFTALTREQQVHTLIAAKLTAKFPYYEKITRSFSRKGLTGDALYASVTEVIADPDLCPPHSTGGAIDLTIIEMATGKEIDMGSKLDDVDDSLAYAFHPSIAKTAQANRLLLFNAMTRAGFANTASEWWHYSYGDQEWAIRTGAPFAYYGSTSST